MEQYDERLRIFDKTMISENQIKEWELEALDTFMKECGDATQYTATVSQYFSIAELFAIKRFMYKHDHRRLLQFAHQRFEQTGLEQWKHSEKWKDYCDVCKANEVLSSMEIMNKINMNNFT